MRFSFRNFHCQSVAKCLLDHMCQKAQVVHHSLPSMNAVPPAPVSSSSWRHGLLVGKIAKHEHVQSIKTRICPLSPEQGAPSFSRKPMMSIDGGVRVRQVNYSELRQMCAAESTFIIPVEELLKHGTPLALPLRERQFRGLPPGPRTSRSVGKEEVCLYQLPLLAFGPSNLQ